MRQKVKRLFLSLCLALLLFVFFGADRARAAQTDSPLVLDGADLLDDEEEEALLEKLQEISDRQGMDVVVATADDLQGYTATGLADAIYDELQYGQGSSRDGILLLVEMEERSWAISTCGRAIRVFTDAGQDYMADEFVPCLRDGDYAAAFDAYADLCDDFITQADSGSPYDTGNMPRSAFSLGWIFISLAAGLVLALAVTGFMRGQLKSVRGQETAGFYRQGGLRLDRQRDFFLYRRVRKTPRPRDNDRPHGGPRGGGSSTHRSPSGTRHGGSHGHF